jgi:hypothetical protein
MCCEPVGVAYVSLKGISYIISLPKIATPGEALSIV